MVMVSMKTFVRRPGNKTNFLKYIIPRIPEFSGTYIEPFLGTGAVYLHLLPNKAILNDLNKDIIGIWKLAREDPEYLIKEIETFKKNFLPLSNQEKLKKCQELLYKLDSFKEDKRTAIYLLLSYCSLNGVLETNKEYKIISLYGNIYTKNSAHIFTEKYKEKLRELPNILKKVKIYSKDYSQVIAKAKQGDFVFLDPPYIERKTYRFNYDIKGTSFSVTNLKDQLEALTIKKVKWMMTQIDTKEVRELFKGYKMFQYDNYNSFRGKIGKKELIITNY
jgi:DNA adenine methylase